MPALNFRLQGFAPAFRDAEVTLTNTATGTTLTRKPFLDGTLLVRDLEAGPYQIVVNHPNLTTPIDTRVIRVFPQVIPTLVPIAVPDDLFRDTPIRDIPDADLGPVQQLVSSARTALAPVAAKSPGEAIRAADWTTLSGVVNDLCTAVLQLLDLVSPRGHAHPEIAEKIDEVQGNLRRFADAFGKSLVELRREIESGNLRRKVDDVLDLGAASADMRDRLHGRLLDLETATQADTTVFTKKLASAGSGILTEIASLVAEPDNAGKDLGSTPQVQTLTAVASHFLNTGTQTRPESELQSYRETTTLGGNKLGFLTGGGV